MTRAAGLLCVCAVVIGGCSVASNLVPRTYARSTSPDGRHTASVWRAPSVDPPDDHLWLSTDGGQPTLLMDLAPDVDWCRSIVWTPDSRKVGFVISDDRLALFDVKTRTLEAFFFLAGTGCCGGPQDSRTVRLNEDGTQVSFERFERATMLLRGKDGRVFEAHLTQEPEDERLHSKRPLFKAAKNLGREVLRVPSSHLRLRLAPAPGDRLPPSIYVTVWFKDQQWIGVTGIPAADGLVTLPAVDDNPPDRLEIGMAGLGGKRIVVRDTGAPGAQIVAVNVPARSPAHY